MFWEIAINHTSSNRFYWSVYMLCMYICAISCWQWAVKWLLHTLLSICVWISAFNLAYCRGNVLMHWQKSVIYTNDCQLLSRAGSVVVLAWRPAALPEKHRNTGRRRREARQHRNSIYSQRERLWILAWLFHYYLFFSEVMHEKIIKTYSTWRKESLLSWHQSAMGVEKVLGQRGECAGLYASSLWYSAGLQFSGTYENRFTFLNIDLVYIV